MSTRYQFVDDSNETRLAGFLVPDPAGGADPIGPAGGDLAGTYPDPTLDLTKAHTWTGEITVDTAATTDEALLLTGTRTTGQAVFGVNYPHTVFTIGSDGAVDFISDDAPLMRVTANGGTEAILRVSGNTNVVQIDTAAGAGLNTHGNGGVPVSEGIATTVITSGALPTAAFVSGTARQLDTTRDVFLCVPFTGDATNNAATLLIQLSPDNVTFTTLDTLSIAAALNLTGAINVPVSLAVPAAWRVKLTATHGTIGTGVYY